MKNRSLFWPIFLIAAGVVWLLIEMRMLPVENLWSLLYIWPIFLMAAGVSLIVRAHWPVVRGLISSLIVLGMLLVVVFAPQLGWNRAPAWGWYHLGDLANFNGSIHGSGVIVTQDRALGDFQSVDINYPIELNIQQGDTPAITLQADDNLLPQLATRVSGGTLYIESNQPAWSQRVNPSQTVKMTLTVKDLNRVHFPSAGVLNINSLKTGNLDISMSGAGSIKLVDLKAQLLTVNLSGAGNIAAQGSTNDLDVNISGMGGFQGGDLACQSAQVSISGAGSATIWAKSSLDVNISGTGSISYYGTPTVTRRVSGIGHVNGLGMK